MLFWTIVKVGLKSLLANKLRSLLAMLGIIIGVGAVISMLAIGAGARQSIMQRISAMGTNLLVIRAGQSSHHGVRSGTTQKLTLDDVDAIVAEVPAVASVAPVIRTDVQAKYLSRNNQTTVIGTSVDYFPIRTIEIDKGRAFTAGEVEQMAHVTVLGPDTVTALFDLDDPIGETVKINGHNFLVIGVFKGKGGGGDFNPDDELLIPYTTAMAKLFGSKSLREIDVHVRDGYDLTDTAADITELLRKRHRTAPGKQEDFYIRNQADAIETANAVAETFTILLGGIASISLVVGGIGIMNIMLVTVTERTREIGIRMAIGAKRKNIRMQFLIESVIISGLGGLIGVAVGVGGAQVIPRLSQSSTVRFSTAIELHSILLSLSFAFLVGVFFGWYPARRAANLDPVESLRYE